MSKEALKEKAKKELQNKSVKDLVTEVRSLCDDRLDAITSEGSVLGLVFEVLEEKLSKKGV